MQMKFKLVMFMMQNKDVIGILVGTLVGWGQRFFWEVLEKLCRNGVSLDGVCFLST